MRVQNHFNDPSTLLNPFGNLHHIQ
uniref:Uncharacterized protein n=1 Tax=Anguilla anguilla TaxID=7936 RepID=A0A0E9SDU6_ANGAN